MVARGELVTAFQLDLLSEVAHRPDHFGMPAIVMPLPGGLDAVTLRRRLRPVVETFPLLRSELRRSGSTFLRRTAEGVDLALIALDPLNRRSVRHASMRIFQQLRLDRAPLFGCASLGAGTDEPWLVFSAHHVLADDQGLSMIGRALSAAAWDLPLPNLEDDALQSLAEGERQALAEGQWDAHASLYAATAAQATPALSVNATPRWSPERSSADMTMAFDYGYGLQPWDPDSRLGPWGVELVVPLALAEREIRAARKAASVWAEELLLGVLAWALAQHTPHPHVLVDVVSGGRGERFGVALTNRLGPTAFVAPIVLDLRCGDLHAAAAAARESLRRLPERGSSFLPLLHLRGGAAGVRANRARILFSFSGRTDALVHGFAAPDGSSRVAFREERVPWWHRDNGHPYDLNVNIQIRGGGVALALHAGSEAVLAALPHLAGTMGRAFSRLENRSSNVGRS